MLYPESDNYYLLYISLEAHYLLSQSLQSMTKIAKISSNHEVIALYCWKKRLPNPTIEMTTLRTISFLKLHIKSISLFQKYLSYTLFLLHLQVQAQNGLKQ